MSNKRSWSISVRDLVEFALRSGNLGSSRDFVPSSAALLGTREHQRLQRSRPDGYKAEVTVSHRIETELLILTIKGRIDGILCSGDQLLIEEIKTTTGGVASDPDPLHWAQAKIYAHLYLDEHPAREVELQLTYADLETGALKEHHVRTTPQELKLFFENVLSVYLAWLEIEVRWLNTRDQSIQTLSFPFAQYRAGQRALAVAAYRTLARGGKLFAEAPTGIGKTVSVLFPAVRALGENRFSKIFYLTAKTVGRAVAEKAIAEMRIAGLRLRSLTLTAKEKLCVRDGQPCDVKTCPLALGYYDRLKAALRDLLSEENLTRPVVERISSRHQVCPFALALDAAPWVDAIICDYNYVFDPQAYLRQFFLESSGRYAFLIDEAHNLVERAREMFSAELEQSEILELKRALEDDIPACAAALRSISRYLTGLRKRIAEEQGIADEKATALQELPVGLLPLLERFLETAELWLSSNSPAVFRQQILDLYFQVSRFVRTAQLYDSHYVTIVRTAERHVDVRLFCLDPSLLLRQALDRGCSAIFFSATLRPMDYFKEILGGAAEDRVLELSSPFPTENLGVVVEDQIATKFRLREASFEQVARSIEVLLQSRQGNYLVYFPSYRYLNEVLARFQSYSNGVEILVQTPNMSENDRDAFIASFSIDRPRTLVGFAVMGGIFGEGIDLVGDRLVGAVVVGVGLPQVCLERELIRGYFQERNGLGFEYAYIFPGMNRVLQAAGRVIRSESDCGTVLLIDSRFRQSQYRQLLPPWWEVTHVRGVQEISNTALEFWRTHRTS
jgi:DNA excision repair protein ERCC-2